MFVLLLTLLGVLVALLFFVLFLTSGLGVAVAFVLVSTLALTFIGFLVSDTTLFNCLNPLSN